MSEAKLLVFADAASSVHKSICELKRQAGSSLLLSGFLRRVARDLQSLASESKEDETKPFACESIPELSEIHEREGRTNAAVQVALSSCCQIGWLLLQVEADPLLLSSKPAIYTGFCIGLIPAVAAAITNGAAQLAALGPSVVSLTARAGLLFMRRARMVDGASTKSWSRIVYGMSEAQAKTLIDSFNTENAVPKHKEAFLAASFPAAVTIGAPPSTWALLEKHDSLSGLRTNDISAAYGFHCPYLSIEGVDDVLASLDSRWSALSTTTTVISGSGMLIAPKSSAREAFRKAIVDALKQPLSWNIFEHELLSVLDGQKVSLHAIGTNVPIKLFDATLKPTRTNCLASSGRPVIQGTSPDAQFEPVAIVGISARTPGGDSGVEELWSSLEQGLDLHREVPADRFDVSRHYDPTGETPNSTTSAFGCFLKQPGLFDPALFRISPREADHMDASHRLMMLTAYEALEMAGYTPDRTYSTDRRYISTFYAQTTDDYREANQNQKIEGAFMVTGGGRAFGPGKISYYFGWQGPSFSLDTACSSSLASLQLACQSLQNGTCRMALVGAGNVMSNPDIFAALSRGGFTSKTGSCKTWDATADGYCRGDAAGTVVVKLLRDAVAENDNIQAVIRGVGTNHAAQAISITRPHAGTQESLFRKVLRDASLSPRDIAFVECHGSGTLAGDVEEVTAVMNTFASGRQDPLYIGAIKANIGHSEGTSGMSSLIKSVLMLEKQLIPPHVGIKTAMNKNLPIVGQDVVRVPHQLTPLRGTGDKQRRILINNFGASGGTSTMILEEPPATPDVDADQRDHHVVIVSGRTEKSLKMNLRRLNDYIRSNPTTRLCDIAYTTTARRMQHVRCQTFVAANLVELSEQITDKLSIPRAVLRRPKSASVILSFSGQPSQYVGMGQELYNTSLVFRNSIIASDAICRQFGLDSLKETIMGKRGQQELEDDVVISHVSLVAFEIATYELWLSWGIQPSAVIGHSLGEYAALYAAGVLSCTDALYLVWSRAKSINGKCTSGEYQMLAIKDSAATVGRYLKLTGFDNCEISCTNAPLATVVGGPKHQIGNLCNVLKEGNIRFQLLPTKHAFHTSQMDMIMDGYDKVARQVTYSAPRVPFASSLLGRIVRKPNVIGPEYLVRQTREKVDFVGAIQNLQHLIDEGARVVDLGPQPLTLPLFSSVASIEPSCLLPTVRKTDKGAVWKTLSCALAAMHEAGFTISWQEFHRDFEKNLRLLRLPSYAFDLSNHWIPYEGDWMLKKNKTSLTNSARTVPPSKLSTTIHRSVEFSNTSEAASAIFSSDLRDEELSTLLSSRENPGSLMFPSSVYVDMALSAAGQVCSKVKPHEPIPALQIVSMISLASKIPEDTQEIQITVELVKNQSTYEVAISTKPPKSERVLHAQLAVKQESNSIEKTYSRLGYMFMSRIHDLTRNGPNSQKLSGTTAYRLLQPNKYYKSWAHIVREISIGSELCEALAVVELSAAKPHDIYTCRPHLVDSLLQPAILTAAITQLQGETFDFAGCGTLHVGKDALSQGSYKAYVRMQVDESNDLCGDVYLFRERQIVAVLEDLCFQRSCKTHSQGTANEAAVRKSKLNALRKRYDSIASLQPGRLPTEDDPLPTCLAAREATSPSPCNTYTPSLTGSRSPQLVFTPPFEEPITPLEHILGEDPKQVSPVMITSEIKSSEDHVAGVIYDLLSLIAKELGFSIEALQPDTEFADLGTDSMVALQVLAKFRSKTGINLPSFFFFDNPTVEAVQKYFENTEMKCTETSKPPDLRTANGIHSSGLNDNISKACSWVQLQGSESSEAPILFMLPDASGSAASYVSLPEVDNRLRVIALDSPFAADPTKFTCSLPEAVQILVRQIREIQPQEPYLLAGWSMGALLAYEATVQLTSAGARVDGLILIDGHNPQMARPLGIKHISLLEELELIKLNDSSRKHFCFGTDAMCTYRPPQLAPGAQPGMVQIIWASHGALEGLDTGSAKGTLRKHESGVSHPLMQARGENGSGGWEQLLPFARYATIDGDHFSIMTRPQICNLAEKIGEALRIVLPV